MFMLSIETKQDMMKLVFVGISYNNHRTNGITLRASLSVIAKDGCGGFMTISLENETKSVQNLIYVHFPCSGRMVGGKYFAVCLSNALRFPQVDDSTSLFWYTVHFDILFLQTM